MELYPDTELAVTNLSGTITDLQNNDTAAWYTANDVTSNTSLRVGMQPTGGPLDGTQTVTFHIRATGTDRIPTVSFYLYEAGTQLQQLGTTIDVTGESGQDAVETFDPTTLSDQSGADVEFAIEGTSTGGPQAQRATVEVGFVTWDAQTATESVTVTTDDASDVTDTTATLNGSLDELTVADSADVWFDWREVGATTWTSTPTQTLTATGSFSKSISGLTETTDYEFRAQAASTDASSTGATNTFSTTETPRVIAGTVTLDGSGVGGATVHLINTTPSPSEHVATVTTEADGSFSHETTVAGELHAVAQHDDGETQYNAPSHHSLRESFDEGYGASYGARGYGT